MQQCHALAASVQTRAPPAQVGCAENDPNSPVFDPVHGVVHHFYQDHLSTNRGHGPIYGHWVSKDFVNWRAIPHYPAPRAAPPRAGPRRMRPGHVRARAPHFSPNAPPRARRRRAQLPVAIWNGLDSSVWPPRVTPYDEVAIYTGSALVLDGAGPGGKGPGVVNIYPGLCRGDTWPACTTGTVLAQAVPADYAGDALLTNWTKPSYNPIVEGAMRDPSTPWRTPYSEWRMRTFDSSVYASPSDADLLAGRWSDLGKNGAFRQCECPSFYPLPPPTPGFEAAYAAAASGSGLPTHVHKTSCNGDWWQLGTYVAGHPGAQDAFEPTAGWEDEFNQRRIDGGNFYASKDNVYPTRDSTRTRRVNWGWARVDPASAQTLPREITFNAAARTLEQAPLAELEQLRGPPAHATTTSFELAAGRIHAPALPAGLVGHAEIVVTYGLPRGAATFGVLVGNVSAPRVAAAGAADACCDRPQVRGADASDDAVGDDDACDGCGYADGAPLYCSVAYTPPTPGSAAGYHEVPTSCVGPGVAAKDTLRVVAGEDSIEMRLFADATFVESYVQRGRVATTANFGGLRADGAAVGLVSDAGVVVRDLHVYPMRSIWTTPEEVRKAPRVYGAAPTRAS